MVSFKFSFGVVGKSKEKGIVNKYVIIVSKCEGIIRYVDGTYKVEYNGKLYSITGESYRTKGKKVVYARRLDKYNHRIKIIRDSENKKTVDTRFYIPFAAGLIAKGKIVKMPFAKELFHITTCYNRGDSESTILAFQEWKEYEDKVKNKLVDINNEL